MIRITPKPLSARRQHRQNGLYGFHESRITAFTLFPLLSCKLWSGMGRLWRGMGGHRPPHRQNGLYGFHETRLFRPFPLTSRQTFLLERPRSPDHAFHESRDTKHESRLFPFSRCFPASCGAAMARHGRPPSPAPATKPVWFSRNTAFSVFPVHRPSGISSGANQAPDQAFHESRDTKHESRLFSESQLPYPRFPSISRHFPPFPGPPTPLRRSRSASPRAPSAAAPASDRQARKRIAART